MEYDEKREVLRITYTSGKVYDYWAVPQQAYDDMKAASSKGQYLNYSIKGKYKYKKVKA